MRDAEPPPVPNAQPGDAPGEPTGSRAEALRAGVPVIADERPPAWPLERAAWAVALATFAALVFGLPLADLLRSDTDARVEQHLRDTVLASARQLAPGLDPAWLDRSPPPLPPRPMPRELLEVWAKAPQLLFLCELNETLLRALWQPGSGLRNSLGPGAPDSILAFPSPDGSPFPGYRYPASVTLPDGLATNNLGFRGPDLAVDKPPRTVRIACVGASITVDGHHFAFSYPELMQTWLDRWASARGLDVRFEVVNAGREAIKSSDVRAIVQHELLPLAVDYVIYHEGANQCGLPEMQKHVAIDANAKAAFAAPPANLAALAAATSPWLGATRRASATVRRGLAVVGFGRQQPEPPKPEQRVQLPVGLDEQDPDPAAAGPFLQMGAVLADLATMQRLCDAAGATLVVTSFPWFCTPGARLHTGERHSLYTHLNVTFWPLRYATIQRLTDLQNRVLLAWAKQRGLPALDIAALLPRDPALFVDAYHTTELGSRLRAWLVTAALLPILERDLAAGKVPVPDRQRDERHPGLPPARRLTAAELDRR